MRRCFHHTDLVQNAVFDNFSRQIAFIQYSRPSDGPDDRSTRGLLISETVQKMSKITYTASLPRGEGRKTSSPKNACVGGYYTASRF